MEQIEAFNRALFLEINAGPHTAPWLIKSATLIANDLMTYLISALLVVMWLWGDEAKRNLILKACLVAMVGVGLNQIIGLAWYHPRPFMIGLGHRWMPHAADASFPSDHMTLFSGIGLSLLLGGAVRPGLITLAAGLGVAWSRVFLGVHFPMDMLGSVGVAYLVYTVVSPAWRKWGDGMTQLAERLYRKVMAWPIKWGWVRR